MVEVVEPMVIFVIEGCIVSIGALVLVYRISDNLPVGLFLFV